MTRGFSKALVDALDHAKIVGVRAREKYRYTGAWVVVVEGRVFVRPWNDKPTGGFAPSCANRAAAAGRGRSRRPPVNPRRAG